MKSTADIAIIEKLQKQIESLQGRHQPSHEQSLSLSMGAMEAAFPNGVFARGAVHELISTTSEEATCTSGFISVVLSNLMQQGGYCLWISTVPRRSVFPPALKAFGIEAGRILFVDTAKPKETLWALEEALKCKALVAVVGELAELDFNDSRRLQLAVEQSQVTGFIHRFRPRVQNAVACVTRWKIAPAASSIHDSPGVGHPRWQVELLKVRNGQPGSWLVEWSPKGLQYITEQPATLKIIEHKTAS